MKKVPLVIAALVLLAGCAAARDPSEPTAQQLASANYGDLTLEQANEKITKRLSSILFYPSESIISPASGLDKLWMLDSVGNFCYGWLAKANVNAMERSGGYSGQKTYAFAFMNGEVVAVRVIDAKNGGIFPNGVRLEETSCPAN